MRQAHRQNTVGPWARRKLNALEQYLAAYHKVMQNQRFNLIYIDAFAGAGWSRVRTAPAEALGLDLPIDDDQAEAEEEFIAGSPVRALATGRGFDHYFFFDADPRRAALLEQLKRDHPQKDIRIKTGDANAGVQKLAAHFHKRPMARGVAFLDPYGPHLHWATVQALAETRKVDVIINFPLAMAINRLITRDGQIRENWVQMLDACFGTHDWHSLAYEAKDDLFGSNTVRKSEAAAERLLALYHGRLAHAFGHTVKPSLVTNTKGNPLYYLLWASANMRGVAIASHIMAMGNSVNLQELRHRKTTRRKG
ncbi:three-Cys-motif partner protein TcmP [Erythrobacter cryptus]|uniref:three-Cys-motif partner protein TcmP n=1 Tax=Erythrobacter cryptus TaxID=196588 RepID=UPI00040359C3|nr:three-Cys-motif partner protein TcmP [Erythrobacter cryptus]